MVKLNHPTQGTLIVSDVSDVISYSEVGPYVLEKPTFNARNIISRSVFLVLSYLVWTDGRVNTHRNQSECTLHLGFLSNVNTRNILRNYSLISGLRGFFFFWWRHLEGFFFNGMRDWVLQRAIYLKTLMHCMLPTCTSVMGHMSGRKGIGRTACGCVLAWVLWLYSIL